MSLTTSPFIPVMVRPAHGTMLSAATPVPVCRTTGALTLATLKTFFPAATGGLEFSLFDFHRTALKKRIFRFDLQSGSGNASSVSGDLPRRRGVQFLALLKVFNIFSAGNVLAARFQPSLRGHFWVGAVLCSEQLWGQPGNILVSNEK